MLVCLLQCRTKTIPVNQPCCMNIEFDGYSKEFFNKHNLYLVIEDIEENNRIQGYIDDLKDTDYINTRLVLWKIKVYDVEGNRLIDLLQLESGEYVYKKSGSLYKNDLFYNFLINKMKVQKIGNFPAPVTQEIYDDLIK